MVTGDLWLVTGDRWPVTGGRWPVTGGRWLVTGHWSLVTGGRRLVRSNWQSYQQIDGDDDSDFLFHYMCYIWIGGDLTQYKFHLLLLRLGVNLFSLISYVYIYYIVLHILFAKGWKSH